MKHCLDSNLRHSEHASVEDSSCNNQRASDNKPSFYGKRESCLDPESALHEGGVPTAETEILSHEVASGLGMPGSAGKALENRVQTICLDSNETDGKMHIEARPVQCYKQEG